MLNIVNFLLSIAISMLEGACLLRLLMQYHRAPFGNPIGQFVMAVSDWLVLPLRRLIPARGRIDLASACAAGLLALGFALILWLLSGFDMPLSTVLMQALHELIGITVQSLIILMIVYALLSWVQPQNPINDVLSRLCKPMLEPIQRIIPAIGGIDLSPMIFIIALQVLRMLMLNA